MTATMSLRALGRATLARQMLLAREETTVPRALERLLAIQAQWPKPPFVAFWSRLQGFEREKLVALAKKRAVVRGTAFRGTIFLMRPDDWAMSRGSVQPTLEKAVKSLTAKQIAVAEQKAVVARARKFFGKAPASFEALRTELAKSGAENARVRAEAFLARMRLPLLQVPDDSTWGWHAQCDFALAESMLDAPIAEAPADEALVLRYLAALGPATIADAQSFLGITKLKDAFQRLRDKLVTFQSEDGKTLFDLPNAPRPDADEEAPVRFLPEFDNAVMGYADRRRALPDAYTARVVLPGLVFARTFLVDGLVAGTWASEVTKKTATLTITPFGARPPRAALEEGEKLIRFLEPEASDHDVVVERASK